MSEKWRCNACGGPDYCILELPDADDVPDTCPLGGHPDVDWEWVDPKDEDAA